MSEIEHRKSRVYGKNQAFAHFADSKDQAKALAELQLEGGESFAYVCSGPGVALRLERGEDGAIIETTIPRTELPDIIRQLDDEMAKQYRPAHAVGLGLPKKT